MCLCGYTLNCGFATLQACWRAYKIRTAFRHRQSNIIAIQCRWRQKLAKRELRRLKQVTCIDLI